jgi:hypothetical protein
MQPRYSSYVSREQRLEIRDRVEKVANLLGSPEVAVDDRHGPKLYSSFLKSLLAAPVARVDRPPVLQKRSSAKSKSVSPTIQKNELHDEMHAAKVAQSTPVTPAPLRPSLSPPPPLAMQPAVGPSNVDYPGLLPGLGMDMSVPDVSDFFSAPLPFDTELLQSMTETGMWPDMAIPGMWSSYASVTFLLLMIDSFFQASVGWVLTNKITTKCVHRLLKVLGFFSSVG